MSQTQHLTYLSALQMIAKQSRDEMATLMPHLGERGRIAEEIVRNVLVRILPRKFSIGTGVLVSAKGETSRQTDIVVYDNFHNSPLLSEFGASVFPVEIVYATIEVKSDLTKSALRSSLEAIRQIRAVGSVRHYLVPEIETDADGRSHVRTRSRVITVPPRSYVLAFSQRGLGSTFEEFKDRVRACLDEYDTHVHGVCVLDNDWLVGRQAFKWPAAVFGKECNALLEFYRLILKHQQNYAVYPVDLDAYLSPPSTLEPFFEPKDEGSEG